MSSQRAALSTRIQVTPAGVNTRQPKKKPRGGELTVVEKDQNSLISKVRIIVEHVICGVKRCRIVKDVFPNTMDKFDDLVMEIACGLHNFRTAYRTDQMLNCNSERGINRRR